MSAQATLEKVVKMAVDNELAYLERIVDLQKQLAAANWRIRDLLEEKLKAADQRIVKTEQKLETAIQRNVELVELKEKLKAAEAKIAAMEAQNAEDSSQQGEEQ